ncbi:MAG: ATP synthase F1 subunit epsilon [Acetobacteraceae bacterium]|jgi:F-type H+-transporting ATPase subunit epsilon
MPINLEIVSPEKLLLSRDVDMVVIPAFEGDMGVLEGHAPVTVILRGGVVSLYEGDRVTDTLFVDGGFAEVTPERCTVLASEAMPTNEIERSEAEKRLQDAEQAMAQVDGADPVQEELALERVHSARAMNEAIDGLLSGH